MSALSRSLARLCSSCASRASLCGGIGRAHARGLCKKSGPPDDEDEFTDIDALDASAPVEDADAASALGAMDTLSSAHDMTPEAAKELVASLVKAASAAAAPDAAARAAPPPLTRDTLRVLRAARIVTTSIESDTTERYPITAIVGVRVDLGALGLSRLATAALEEIAGPRVKDGVFTVKARRFATMEENMAHGVGLAGRAVAEAQMAVGEEVDLDPLSSWEDVLEATREVTKNESEEVRRLVDHIAASETAGVEDFDPIPLKVGAPRTGLEAIGTVERALHAGETK